METKVDQRLKQEIINFDVFLCHNSQDKPEVRAIALQLKQQRLQPWLDEWQLRPGLPWQRELERQIQNIRSAAVFVGGSGIGPWQQMEIEAYLRRFVNHGCSVIPVLLPNAPNQPDLPLFLEGMTWVDFRRSVPEPMGRLIWGITGINPLSINPSLPNNDRTSRLNQLLAQGNWKEADRETMQILLRIGDATVIGDDQKRTEVGWLRKREVERIPIESLKEINNLWLTASGGKFGYSVQNQIWLDIVRKSNSNDTFGALFPKFVYQVGWRVDGRRTLSYDDFDFSLNAPDGHLPTFWFPCNNNQLSIQRDTFKFFLSYEKFPE